MESISTDHVDGLINELVSMTIEHVMQERLTNREARRMRAALSNADVVAQIRTTKETVLAALIITVPDVFKAALDVE